MQTFGNYTAVQLYSESLCYSVKAFIPGVCGLLKTGRELVCQMLAVTVQQAGEGAGSKIKHQKENENCAKSGKSAAN